MAKISSQVIGTVKKYQNSVAIKKHNAIVRAWAAPCARDVAAVFWSTWKDIESRIPTSADGDFREADRQMTAAEKRALKNKYTAATRAAVNAASPQLERVLRYYEEKVFLAGLVEHARSLECLQWMMSLRTNRHVKEEGKFAEADNLNISGAFSLPNYRAQKYARDHAAEAVTRINSTTRKEIARIVQQGVENGTSYGDISDAIRSKFKDFAVPQPQKHIANRGVLVAVTELANAYCEANLQTAGMLQQSGVQMMKAWQTLEDDRVSDGCEANQSAGWIPLDREFPSGHMRPPRFPGCRCDMLTDVMVPGAIGRSIDWYFDHEDELWTDAYNQLPQPESEGSTYDDEPSMFRGLVKQYSSEVSDKVKQVMDSILKDVKDDPDRYGLTYMNMSAEEYMPNFRTFKNWWENLFGSDRTLERSDVRWLQAQIDKGNLTENEAGKLLLNDVYCGVGTYEWVNKTLRGQRLNKREYGYAAALRIEECANMINRAMDSETLEKGFTGYRYLRQTPKKFLRQLSPGSVFKDEGFTSLTTTEEHDFASLADVIMHIEVPPGKGRGFYAQALQSVYPNNYGVNTEVVENSGEHEFVLKAGTSFIVTKRENNVVNGIPVTEVWLTVYDEEE